MTTTTAPATARPLWQVGLLTVLAAVVVNVLYLQVLLAAFPLPRDFLPFTPGPITFFTLLGALGAVLAFALVRRLSAHPVRTFWIVAVIALILSVVPNIVLMGADPATLPFPGFTPQNAVVLMTFHALAALVCGAVLTTLGVKRRA